MSQLEKLLYEFCPNGVEYISISECVKNIRNIKWSQKEICQYRYIDLTSVDRELHQIIDTQIINANNAPSRAQQIVQAGDVLFGTTRPTLKRYCFIDNKYVVPVSACYVRMKALCYKNGYITISRHLLFLIT